MDWFSGRLEWHNPDSMFVPYHTWHNLSFKEADEVVDMIQEKVKDADFTYYPAPTSALGRE